MELPRLIELLAARQSPQARMESDKPVQIWTPDGWKEGNAPIPGQQVARMIALVAPAHVRALIHDLNARYSFDFAHPNGTFRVDVEVVAGRRVVWVTRLDANGLPVRPCGESVLGLDFDGPTTSAPVATPTTIPTIPGGFDSPNTAPTGAEDASWYYAHAEQSMGPHSFEQMKSLVTSGALPRDTMVYHPRAGDWQQAKLSALGAYFPREHAPEWVNPATQNWKPPSQTEVLAEKFLVRGVSIGGVALVALLVGWLGWAQRRGSTRGFDYSKQAVVAAERLGPLTSGQLHNIRLTRSDSNRERYYGTAQYSNNYLADIGVEIKERDFWSKPRIWELTEIPHDFTGELESLVASRMNRKYAQRGADFRMTSVSLQRGDNNQYLGTCRWDDSTSGSVQTQITSFDAQGQLATWTMSVDAN